MYNVIYTSAMHMHVYNLQCLLQYIDKACAGRTETNVQWVRFLSHVLLQ